MSDPVDECHPTVAMSGRGRLIRRVGIGIGVLYLAAALIVEALHASQVLLIYLAIAGILVIASVFSWRGAARQSDGPEGYWQMTGQRFRDPKTGRTMELRHNPVTGERDYVEVDDSGA